MGEGRNVFIAIRPGEIRLDASLHDEVIFDDEHGTEEDDPEVNEDVYEVAEDEQAEAIVRKLLEEELLELVSPSSMAGLCSRLAAYLGCGAVTSGGLLDVLVDSVDVAEVYATEGDVDRILDGARVG